MTNEQFKQAIHLMACATEMQNVLNEYIDSMIHKSEVDKWYNKHKNDKEANQVLVKAIKVIKKIPTPIN